MKQYLMGLFVLAVCCAVVELLSPEGEGGGIARHIRLMSGLCLLCVALSPLAAWLESGETPFDALSSALDGWLSQSEEETSFEQRWKEQSEQLDLNMAGAMVEEMLEERFDLSASDCRVTLAVGRDGVLSEVRVALTGRAIWVNTKHLQDYIRQALGCESTVYIE